MLRIEQVQTSNWEEALREPWRALHASAPDATPFQSWEWLTSWAQTLGRARRPLILAAYEGRDLVGLMPLALTSVPWRCARWMGSGVSDYLEPLAAPGHAAQVGFAFWNFLLEQQGIDLIDLHQVRTHQPFGETAAGDQSAAQAECPVLSLPATFHDYLPELGKSLRYDVKRGLARGDYRLAANGAEALEAWRHFLNLHSRRWRKRGLPGAFGLPGIQRFHEAWIPRAHDRGLLRFWTLRHENEVVGALYCMRAGRSTFFYQSGFAPHAKSVSPGTTLIAAAIRHAIEEGCEEFDFLRGAEPYKLRWKPQHVRQNARLLVRKPSIMGSIGHRVNVWESQVEAKVRARLEGRGWLG